MYKTKNTKTKESANPHFVTLQPTPGLLKPN